MTELPIQVQEINKRLKIIYGMGQNSNNQLYRIVFSDNERENRIGFFNTFIGKIFLRQEKGNQSVKKYIYIKSKFLIEKWNSSEIAYTPELPESIKGSYEPLYIFEDSQGNYLPVNEKAALMVCYANFNPTGYWERKNQLEDEERKREKEEYEDIYFSNQNKENLSDVSSIDSSLVTDKHIILTDN